MQNFIAFSSLMLRFTDDDFDSEQALTIGVDFKTKVVNIDGVNVKLGNLVSCGEKRQRFEV